MDWVAGLAILHWGHEQGKPAYLGVGWIPVKIGPLAGLGRVPVCPPPHGAVWLLNLLQGVICKTQVPCLFFSESEIASTQTFI